MYYTHVSKYCEHLTSRSIHLRTGLNLHRNLPKRCRVCRSRVIHPSHVNAPNTFAILPSTFANRHRWEFCVNAASHFTVSTQWPISIPFLGSLA